MTNVHACICHLADFCDMSYMTCIVVITANYDLYRCFYDISYMTCITASYDISRV